MSSSLAYGPAGTRQTKQKKECMENQNFHGQVKLVLFIFIHESLVNHTQKTYVSFKEGQTFKAISILLFLC